MCTPETVAITCPSCECQTSHLVDPGEVHTLCGLSLEEEVAYPTEGGLTCGYCLEVAVANSLGRLNVNVRGGNNARSSRFQLDGQGQAT